MKHSTRIVLGVSAAAAAVALTLRQRVGVRHQSAAQQVVVQATDRVRVIKVASEQMASVSPAPAPVVDPTQENAK